MPTNETTRLSPWEIVAKGRVPPLDATALDADAAVVLWRAYPFHRERLRLHLDDHNRETFERLSAMDEETLEQHWPRGEG